MEISTEVKKLAKNCKTTEEILALAQENNIDITAEEAAFVLERVKDCELTDDELDNVTGGAEGCKGPGFHEIVYFKSKEEVQFLFNEGDIVEALSSGIIGTFTATCKVVERKIWEESLGWVDVYWLEKVPGSRAPFIKGNRYRNDIQK